jgi:hypothetical protein
MAGAWTPVFALAATLLALLWAYRWITRGLQELSVRWAGDVDVALILYFVVVLPGVIVHEVSHLLMALLLRVKVRRFSLGPRRQGKTGRVSLGSIQVGNVDPVRGSLIGVAPLLGGAAVILLIGNRVLGVNELAQALSGRGIEGILAGLSQAVHVADFWLWLYLIFAVSNAMLPSYSDMQAMRPVLLFLAIVVAVVLVVTGVPAVAPDVVSWVSHAASYLAYGFGLTLAADLVFMLVIGLLLLLTRRVQGRRMVAR